MIKLVEKEVLERYNSLSPKLKEALESEAQGAVVDEILGKHLLSDDDAEIVRAFTGYTLLGLLAPKDILNEIKGLLAVDEKIAVEIIREINQKIFLPLHDELEGLYRFPIPHERGGWEQKVPPPPEPPRSKNISLEALAGAGPARTETVPLRAPAAGAALVGGGVGPFILHEEKGVAAEAQKGFKGFSVPLSFLRSKMATNAAPKAAAQVEMPPTISKAEEKPRVIHYSELRTPISPFGQSEEFINLETFEKFAHPSPGSGVASPTPAPAISIKPSVEEVPPPVAPVAETTPVEIKPEPTTATPEKFSEVSPPKIIAPEGGEPKLKGNTVDLR
ncbi:MAG: hypothetical protein V1696_00270 [Candidatus Jorgensenbacteria bacterium]